MADYAFRRQPQVVHKYQRPRIVNSLLRAESDMTSQARVYSLSVDIVKRFSCYLSNGCRKGMSLM